MCNQVLAVLQSVRSTPIYVAWLAAKQKCPAQEHAMYSQILPPFELTYPSSALSAFKLSFKLRVERR